MTRRATRAADSDDVAKWSAQLEAMDPPRVLFRTKPDGSCLFRAFAIAYEGSDQKHEAYRIKAVDYMTSNQEHFMAFLCPSSKGAFLKYCQLMRRPGCWGGHLELTALAHAYQVNVALHRIGRPVDPLIHMSDTAPLVELAFHTSHTEHYSAVLVADESTRSLPAHANRMDEQEPTAPASLAPLGESKVQANQLPPTPAACVAGKKEGKAAAQKPSGAGPNASQPANPAAAEPEASKSPSDPADSTGLGLGTLDLGPAGPAEPRDSVSGSGAESVTPTEESDPGHPSLEELDLMSLAELKALYFEVLGVKTRLRTPSKIVAILMGAFKVERALKNNSQEV